MISQFTSATANIVYKHVHRLERQVAALIARSTGSPAQQTHTAGATVTVANQPTGAWIIINPASVLGALTITLPAAPIDGQLVEISFGGTITSGAVVTALTIAANTGQGLIQASAPTTANAGDLIAYRYRLSNTKWYRVK